MLFLYNLFIVIYTAAAGFLALFQKKAALWKHGRKGLLKKMEEAFHDNESPVAWFHCASLGEFEQARPLLEAFKKNFPEYKILLTFFSPSGYEVRKNYPVASYVFYLPIDTKHNAARFIATVKPSIVFFTKYEFWYHYLYTLKSQGIPVISFSAIFRPEQVFFKGYGKFYLGFLTCFTKIFVQDQFSLDLLEKFGIRQTAVCGDTRFERVAEQAGSVKEIPLVAAFKGNQDLIIVGSSWPADIQVLLPALKELSAVKIIIAPHEIKEAELLKLEQNLNSKTVRFSKADLLTMANFNFLLIDNIGMLSSLYQYATLVYIGGGFGKGIHNILEAAAFGTPLLFGPNYKRFKEARELTQSGCAFPLKDATEAKKIISSLLQDHELRGVIREKAKEYVSSHAGATAKIIDYCRTILDKK